MSEWINPFTVIGMFVCGMIIIFLIYAIVLAIKEWLLRLKRRHEYKHRFNKPPLAKCYCKDCESYSRDGFCGAHSGWYVADNWFCWFAEPRKHEPPEDKEKEGL